MLNFKRAMARTLSATVLLMSLTAVSVPASAGTELMNATFESGTEGFSARATESVSRVSTKAYDGTYCLMVSSRTDAWNGAVASLGADWVSGESYSFSCAVCQESGAAVDMQLSLQYDDASGKTQYDHIAAGSVGSEWTLLSNPDYTIPAGATNRYLYVETAESLCDFYVDSVISEKPSVYLRGDVNHDEKIDKRDVEGLMGWLMTQDTEVYLDTADLDKNGILTAADLSLLRQFFLYPELTATTTTTTTTAPETTPAPATVTEPVQLAPGQWYNTADISWIDPSKPMVALSFDDGPVYGNNYASRIQDALTQSGFHATFFYVGQNIDSNQAEILEAEKRGFEVANHTWTHTDLRTYNSANEILNEYTKCKDKLNSVLGVNRDYLVRLPYLGCSDLVSSTLPVPFPNCGLDSGDWSGNSADVIIGKVQGEMNSGALNGKIVLMHETYDATATAMEKLCPMLKANGWQVVTVSEMFKAKGQDMYAGKVYNYCP